MAMLKRLRALGSLRFKNERSSDQPTTFQKIELGLKALTFVAAIIGGVWALHLYSLAGSDSWAVNIKLETKVLPYHDNLRLLVVNIKTVNPRNFELELDPAKGDSYELHFRQFPSSIKYKTVIDENGGDLIQNISLLPKGEPYDFLPGLEMDDMRVIVVPARTIVLITAKIQKNTGKTEKYGKPDIDYVTTSTVVRVE